MKGLIRLCHEGSSLMRSGRRHVADPIRASTYAATLDAMLAEPSAFRHLPQVVWAYDAALGACRMVRWADPRESRSIRRTALAVATHEALARAWRNN
jgi:hypothetical protein